GTAYVRAASKNFFLSMVARVFCPGCQADHMIVLEGPQGIGKSKALRTIGGQWFCEQHESATNHKSFGENLQGYMLVEISEMDSCKKAKVKKEKPTTTPTKVFFSKSYPPPGGDPPRRCFLAGTTNRDDWTRDKPGARRFWPIACGEIDLEAIRANRAQFFAES